MTQFLVAVRPPTTDGFAVEDFITVEADDKTAAALQGLEQYIRANGAPAVETLIDASVAPVQGAMHPTGIPKVVNTFRLAFQPDRKTSNRPCDKLFPGFDVPDWFPENCVDISYGNDTSPSFERGPFRIYVDSADPDQSEYPDYRRGGHFKRFLITDSEDNTTLFESDVEADVIKWLERFPKFQATGRDCENLGATLRDDSLAGRNGRAYVNDQLFIEDSTNWPTDAPGYGKGKWTTMIGRNEPQHDDLAHIESHLYAFASSEEYEF